MKKTTVFLLVFLVLIGGLSFILFRYKSQKPLLAIFKILRSQRQGVKNGSSAIVNPPTYAPVDKSSNLSNPFGIMPGSPDGMTIETKIKVAKELGAVYYRTASAVFIDRWNGGCQECTAASDSGLKLVLTVRNGGGNGNPSTPPTNMNAYLKDLEEILAVTKPSILAVENEENSMALFYSGTPEQYKTLLTEACKLAHTKGIKCANGGLVSSLVVGLVYQDYKDRGLNAQAEAFITKALTEDKRDQLLRAGSKIDTQIQRGRDLLATYKASGADYVNFHWYSDSPEALDEAVSYLEKYTGLPAISNEMGQQKNTDPKQVRAIMQKVVDIKLPVAIWYSIDTPGFGEAKALTEANGTLRANGIEYKNFISEHY